MTQALTTTRRQRSPAKASGRLRKAAEHYVRNGCKAIGPSLVYAGFAKLTAAEPSKNGYTHDRLVEVARYWDRGAQVTARSHLADAMATLAALTSPDQPGAVRGSAAKTLVEMAKKEEAEGQTAETTSEEQAKWMALIRHWKRTFLRRGILLGMSAMTSYDPPFEASVIKGHRAVRLLESLNYDLGKGPRPEWMETEEDTDGSTRLLGSESDPRSGQDEEDPTVEGELVE